MFLGRPRQRDGPYNRYAPWCNLKWVTFLSNISDHVIAPSHCWTGLTTANVKPVSQLKTTQRNTGQQAYNLLVLHSFIIPNQFWFQIMLIRIIMIVKRITLMLVNSHISLMILWNSCSMKLNLFMTKINPRRKWILDSRHARVLVGEDAGRRLQGIAKFGMLLSYFSNLLIIYTKPNISDLPYDSTPYYDYCKQMCGKQW